MKLVTISEPGRSPAISIATSSLPPGAKNQSWTTAVRELD
jgi:hypothetical protein